VIIEFGPGFHLDAEAAKGTFFGGLAASGWHTAAITMSLLVRSGMPIAGVTGLSLAQRIRIAGGAQAEFAASAEAAIDAAVASARPGDIILTLGAGNVSQLGPQILQRFGKK